MATRLASSQKWQAVPRGLAGAAGICATAAALAFPARKPDKVYGKIGNLEVRLATRRREIKLAQRLRYKVFYEEMSAVPTLRAELRRRDEDPYDAVCDHLLVVDEAAAPATKPGAGSAPERSSAPTACCARTSPSARSASIPQSEYDIAPLLAASPPPLHGARPLLRARALSQQAHGRAACGTACGPTCASTRST